MTTVVAYVDGSCNNKDPKYGGWGFVVTCGDHPLTVCCLGPQDKSPTKSGRMEVQALYELLVWVHSGAYPPEWPHEVEGLEVYSDSQYVVKGANDHIYSWPHNDWKTTEGKPVANVDLWQAVRGYKMQYSLLLELFWVPGHQDVLGNELADTLANKGRMLQSKAGGRVYVEYHDAVMWTAERLGLVEVPPV